MSTLVFQIKAPVICPHCERELRHDIMKAVVYCSSTLCPNHNVRFKAPTVELRDI